MLWSQTTDLFYLHNVLNNQHINKYCTGSYMQHLLLTIISVTKPHQNTSILLQQFKFDLFFITTFPPHTQICNAITTDVCKSLLSSIKQVVIRHKPKVHYHRDSR